MGAIPHNKSGRGERWWARQPRSSSQPALPKSGSECPHLRGCGTGRHLSSQRGSESLQALQTAAIHVSTHKQRGAHSDGHSHCSNLQCGQNCGRGEGGEADEGFSLVFRCI